MKIVVRVIIVIGFLFLCTSVFSAISDHSRFSSSGPKTRYYKQADIHDDSRLESARIKKSSIIEKFNTKEGRDACQLTKFNGTPSWIQFYWDIGDGSVQYFDPGDCGSGPTYPFEITSLQFTLYVDYESTSYNYMTFPVEMDIVVYDLAAGGDPCDGPGDVLYRFSISADEASYRYPNVGTALFPDPCCVNNPVFVGVEYTDSRLGQDTLPPCIIADTTTIPAMCEQWFYDVSDGEIWETWDEHFTDSVGYQYWYVNGETNSESCIISEDKIISSLPYTDSGSTVGYTDDYDADCGGGTSDSPDIVYAYTPTVDEEIYISLCNSNYDTKLFVYENGVSYRVACNEDYCGYDGMKSKVWYLPLFAGNTYYIVVDGWGGLAGDYEISVDYFVEYVVECPSGGTPEGEPTGCDYPDITNGGCNSDTPVFGSIECGETVCGKSGTFEIAGEWYRDTDWYQFTLTELTSCTFIVQAEFPVLFGLIETDPIGSGDCDDNTGYVSPSAKAFPEEVDTLEIMLDAGIYWFYVAPQSRTKSPCDAEYWATMNCDCAIKADFKAFPRWGIGNLNVSFTNNSISDYPPTTYLWDFGDNQTSSATNPTHYYNTPGWYDVTLTVTNGCGSIEEVKERFIYVASTEEVSFDITSPYGSPVLFSTSTDIDNDNNPDLLYSGIESSNNLMIAFGNGDGTFEDPVEYLPDFGPFFDFGFVNGDTLKDIIVADSSGIAVLLNDGGRSFSESFMPYPENRGNVPSIATGYFNDDSFLDFVIGPNIVYFGDGQGGFTSSINLPKNIGSAGIADFNKDGFDDILATGYDSSYMYLSDGSGNFTYETLIKNPSGVSLEASTNNGVADFNRDGNVDFVYVKAEYPGEEGYILIGFGDGLGGTIEVDTIKTYGRPYGIKLTDVNRDKNLDIAVCNTTEATLELYLGDGTGNFNSLVVVEIDSYNFPSVAVGDFDRDGNPDFAAGQDNYVTNEQTILILLNNLPDAPVLEDEMTTTGFGEVTLDVQNPGMFEISRNITTVGGSDYWRLDIDKDSTLDEATRDYNLQLGEYIIVIHPRSGANDPVFSIGIQIDGSLEATPFLNYNVNYKKSWTGDRQSDSIVFYYTVEESSSIQPPSPRPHRQQGTECGPRRHEQGLLGCASHIRGPRAPIGGG